jgi:hypothetical protein
MLLIVWEVDKENPNAEFGCGGEDEGTVACRRGDGVRGRLCCCSKSVWQRVEGGSRSVLMLLDMEMEEGGRFGGEGTEAAMRGLYKCSSFGRNTQVDTVPPHERTYRERNTNSTFTFRSPLDRMGMIKMPRNTTI